MTGGTEKPLEVCPEFGGQNSDNATTIHVLWVGGAWSISHVNDASQSQDYVGWIM